MAEIYERYREKLHTFAEPKYQKFMASLIPGAENILGVRSPDMKKLSKELAKDDWRAYFEQNRDIYYEETLLQGSVIGLLKEDIEVVLTEARRYIPKITNWALCDSFCGGLKLTKDNKTRVWAFLMDYVNSDKPYEIRFAVVMMLIYYIDDEHTAEMLRLFEDIKNEDYYVKMAVAWAVSMCYVNQPELTINYLKNNRLDDFTYNKSLQKICESIKPSTEEKAVIKAMRRRTAKKNGHLGV
ncbi:MAG: DNA alkylation repair protein [Firmicutes bacterium HGW-Firmicutes-16]|nr:MAG: DNA alkylation repair protein [Firmicutes bacterium HGW-Firmicutes-16]